MERKSAQRLGMKQKKLTKKQKEGIIDMKRQGYSTKFVAAFFDCSTRRVMDIFRHSNRIRPDESDADLIFGLLKQGFSIRDIKSRFRNYIDYEIRHVIERQVKRLLAAGYEVGKGEIFDIEPEIKIETSENEDKYLNLDFSADSLEYQENIPNSSITIFDGENTEFEPYLY
ncbi:hypothetical protein TVAG_028880 [Trichomonas vaginalis G3]|uniref:Uncharacterized protein n=1 Tax=Trichomonas vaginalis (strain ATCC PRA-98 / G3) TaxID=412133 RepID=A2E0D5_TRIV3|nr:hypothetical protein TVAGG3_0556250 [Trichomonas vaginalis G3]EAY13935.1 hypothetical protein TVAG_028880 [Trichomonas vaginalis G3]KAI5520870.1 hypothetical protein TVAGG3_0556250 [Trichomonas vaginalis G3]|eukprot:XP_001326158.1 hypothetical protein [Trichomonas vaginalis G3]